MLRRIKIEEPSRLTVIPSNERESAGTKLSAPGQSEGRELLPQQTVAPTAKAPAIGAFKANRKRILMGAAVAVLLGMIVLHEKLNWRLLAGGACIIAGLALIVLRKRRKPLSAIEEEPELVPKP